MFFLSGSCGHDGREFYTPIDAETFNGATSSERHFLSVSGGDQPMGRDAFINQILSHHLGTAHAQTQIIGAGANFIRVSFQSQHHARIFPQDGDVSVQNPAGLHV